MRIEQLGDGPPEVAVVGGIHGDEPAGVHAVETFMEADVDVQRPLALVIANERAMERGTRYVDTDLNRAFPGDPDAQAYESRLAAELAQEIGDCATLALHSTQSYDYPFAIVSGIGTFERSVCPQLPVDAVVDTSHFSEGRIFTSIPRTIEVECGYQRSSTAASNAVALTRAFLAATDVAPAEELSTVGPETPLDDRYDPGEDLPVFRLTDRVPKSTPELGASEPAPEPDAEVAASDRPRSYSVHVENFRHVPAGEPFAAIDDETIVADEPFYPVLMSADGYEELFGYAAERTGRMER